MEIKYC